jgi:hypothetical protein
MRIPIDITEDQLIGLAALAGAQDEPFAAVIRRAIDQYLEAHRVPLSSCSGIWDTREDGLAYQDRLRAEWLRAE